MSHDDAVGVAVALVVQPHVLDPRLTERLDVVAPAASLEVVQPALPLGEQVGRHQPAEVHPVLGVPGLLDLEEQVPRGRADVVGRELRVVLGRLGGGQLDAALAL